MPVYEATTKEKLEKYCDIWLPVWKESGYELESYITPGIQRFIFSDKDGDYGCCEFNPYDYKNAMVNDTFPFHQFSELHNKKVVELEKLVIISEKRGSLKRLLEQMYFVTTYVQEREYDYMIALLNPDLYHKLVWRFKLPIKKLVSIGNDLPYIPCMLASQEMAKTKFALNSLTKKPLLQS